MKSHFYGIVLVILLGFSGCASAPAAQQKPFVDQAIWNQTTKDKVYSACLTALTMANIAVHPVGIEKESGIIVTKPRGRHISYPKATFWHYTLQITIFENTDNKVIVSLTAVDVGSNGSPPEPGWREMRHYFNDSIANDAEVFFNQLDNLLGKADSYRTGKVLFPL